MGSCGAWCAAVFAALAAAFAVLLGASAGKPANQTWACHFVGSCLPAAVIHGTVSDGWEGVRKEFERSFAEGREDAAQVAVYHKGKRVVDLWATARNHQQPGGEINADSVGPVFSCTKVIESLVVAMMVDRGHLDYDEPIAKYWPAFGSAHGGAKAHITVSQLMRHQAGLAAPDAPISADDVLDPVRLGAVLEQQRLNWVPDTSALWPRQLYHAVTRGLYASELVRRADPKGRTLGEFFRQEVAAPLNLSFYIGITEAERAAAQPIMKLIMSPPSLLLRYLPQFFLPDYDSRRRFLGGDEHDVLWDFEVAHFGAIPKRFLTGLWAPGDWELNSILIRSLAKALAFFSTVTDVNSEIVQRAELPSAGGLGNARSMARIASMIAAEDASSTLFRTPEGRARAFGPVSSVFDQGLGINVTLTAAGWGIGRFRAADPRFSAYTGWAGAAGAVFQFNARDEVGFAYVPTLTYTRIHKPRGLRLMKAVQDVIDSMKETAELS